MDDAGLRATNVAIFRRFLEALNRWHFETLHALMTEDFALRLPFAPIGKPRSIDGRDNVEAYIRALSGNVETTGLHDFSLDTLGSDPNELVGQYRSDMWFAATDTRYQNTYISRATVRDGRLARLCEHYDPVVMIGALGGTVLMPAAASQ